MARIASDHDRGTVGGGHGRNREEGIDSEEGQGRVLEQSPGVQRERSRGDTVNLKIERSSGTGTRWGCRKLGWWGELWGFHPRVIRDPVVSRGNEGMRSGAQQLDDRCRGLNSGASGQMTEPEGRS